ncbi:hypothetical protein DFH29DRAFT_162924 [Suillus ampliporus]|nr:hypothetical protein DFH29DRAFT_162924 [Suillus ampliporus]
MRPRSNPRSFGLPYMRLLMMVLLLHTVIIILAAPANIARRTSIAEPSSTVTQGIYPDSTTASSRNFVDLTSNTLGSGSATSVLVITTASVATAMTAPTGTSLTAPTASNELSNTFTFTIDETSLRVCMVGIILAASFTGIALVLVSVLTCMVFRCMRRIPEICNTIRRETRRHPTSVSRNYVNCQKTLPHYQSACSLNSPAT